MMMLNGSGIFPILLFIFIGWVFIGSTSDERLDRACRPTQWVGSIAVSAVDLTVPTYSRRIKEGFESFDFSCQYTLWRLFYEDEWKQAAEQAKDAIKRERKTLEKAIDDF